MDEVASTFQNEIQSRNGTRVEVGSYLGPQLTDLRQGVIRVHAPQHAKISMAIQLDNETKAKDVMARFDYENGSVGEEDDDCFLSQTVPLSFANAYYRDVWVISNHSLFSLSRGTRSTSRRPRQYLFEVGGNIGTYH